MSGIRIKQSAKEKERKKNVESFIKKKENQLKLKKKRNRNKRQLQIQKRRKSTIEERIKKIKKGQLKNEINHKRD